MSGDVLIFGSDNCKYCHMQREHLERSSESSWWSYVDVGKNKGNVKIAYGADIEDLPTVVLFDEDGAEIYRKAGTVPPDEIFIRLSEDKSRIPFDKIKAEKLQRNEIDHVILTYDPMATKVDSIVEAFSYPNERIADIRVLSIEKMSTDEMTQIFGDEEVAHFQSIGGRKAGGWVVKFEKAS